MRVSDYIAVNMVGRSPLINALTSLCGVIFRHEANESFGFWFSFSTDLSDCRTWPRQLRLRRRRMPGLRIRLWPLPLASPSSRLWSLSMTSSPTPSMWLCKSHGGRCQHLRGEEWLCAFDSRFDWLECLARTRAEVVYQSDSEIIYRPLPKTTPELDEFKKAGIDTMEKCFNFAVTKHGNKRMVGTRAVLKEEDEVQPNGKVFQKWEMGDYQWMTYNEVSTNNDLIFIGLINHLFKLLGKRHVNALWKWTPRVGTEAKGKHLYLCRNQSWVADVRPWVFQAVLPPRHSVR